MNFFFFSFNGISDQFQDYYGSAPGAVTVPDSGSEAPGSDFDPGHSHSHEKSCYLNQKKNGNTETGSGTAFPRLNFQDWISGTAISGTAFPRSQELGLHFKYHGSDHISSTTETRLNFGTGTVFPISWESAPHFQDHGTGSALLRSRKRHFKLTKGDKIIKTYN